MQKKYSMIVAVTASLCLSACGEENSADGNTETTASELVTSQEPSPTENPAVSEEAEPETGTGDTATADTKTVGTGTADLKRGARQFLKCRSCHTLAEGEKHKIGPNLWDFLGAKSAAKSDFKYSAAFAALDLTWSEENLDLFLKRPSKFAPGTIMSFAGIPKEKDRRDLIGYLIQETSPNPQAGNE